jgi:hypothetical protein
MGVQIEMQRRHPRAPAHAVTFAWWRKQGDEYRAALEERQRSKVGRMARLRGEVETVKALDELAADEEVGALLETMRAKERKATT